MASAVPPRRTASAKRSVVPCVAPPIVQAKAVVPSVLSVDGLLLFIDDTNIFSVLNFEVRQESHFREFYNNPAEYEQPNPAAQVFDQELLLSSICTRVSQGDIMLSGAIYPPMTAPSQG